MRKREMAAHRAKSKDLSSHNKGIKAPWFVGLSRRSGGVRMVAVQVVGRFWLAAMIIVIAAAGLACRRSELSGSNRDALAGREITVSAAVSLRDAFRELSKQYEERTGAKVNFNFGASGALQKQIESGAPVDVFASAGIPQMDALATQGLRSEEHTSELQSLRHLVCR